MFLVVRLPVITPSQLFHRTRESVRRQKTPYAPMPRISHATLCPALRESRISRNLKPETSLSVIILFELAWLLA